mmetsp:Transcript_62879/g.175214  ORF Transcript_62879/g.175214 Transcript_62879/m.175214 type:complete len:269 (+) Transcript_62879:901-1707(+)
MDEAENVDPRRDRSVLGRRLSRECGHQRPDVLRRRRAGIPQERFQHVAFRASLLPELHVGTEKNLTQARAEVLLIQFAPGPPTKPRKAVHTHVYRSRIALAAGAHAQQQIEDARPYPNATARARTQQRLDGLEDPRQEVVASGAIFEQANDDVDFARLETGRRGKGHRGRQQVREYCVHLSLVLDADRHEIPDPLFNILHRPRDLAATSVLWPKLLDAGALFGYDARAVHLQAKVLRDKAQDQVDVEEGAEHRGALQHRARHRGLVVG